MKVEGQNFTNSETCKGVVFSPQDAPVDFAAITITGRYPEEGWAMNREVHEVVRIHRGARELAVREACATRLLQGDVVHVPPNTAFAWNSHGGEMILHMSCSPPFHPDQYELIKDELLEGEDTI